MSDIKAATNLPPRLWWVRSDSGDGANCYAAPDAVSALELAAPDFGYEDADDLDDLTVSEVSEQDVDGLQEEIARLTARVAELEDSARWRPAHEAPEGVPVYVLPVGYSGIGRRYGGDWYAGSYGSTACPPPTHYRAIDSEVSK